MRFLGAKLAKTARPRPRLEKQLSALLIPHSWIRGRVCVIISNEIEIRKGKRRGELKGMVAQKFLFHLLPSRKFSINTPVQAVPGLLLLLVFDCRSRTRGLMCCCYVRL